LPLPFVKASGAFFNIVKGLRVILPSFGLESIHNTNESWKSQIVEEISVSDGCFPEGLSSANFCEKMTSQKWIFRLR
jgi:hypothetical protein